MKDKRKYLEALLLAGTAWLFLHMYISGEIALFIHSRFHFLTLTTGIVLAGLALTRLFLTSQTCSCTRLKPYIYSIFLLPIIIGLFSPPRILDAGLANRRGISLQPPLTVPAWSAPARGSILLDPDNYMTIYANLYSDPEKYAGRVIEVEGFVLHKDQSGPGTFIVARYAITCCIADATVLGFISTLPGNGDIHENQWLRVVGVVRPEFYNNHLVPMLIIQQVQLIPAPANPYIFAN